MAVEHKNLTGAQLHEPKGVAAAPNGSVYIANGSGSGVWTDRFSGIYKPVNRYNLSTPVLDVGVLNAPAYFVLPFKSRIVGLKAVAYDVISGVDNLLTIYISGVPLSTEKLTLATAGSFAGKTYSRTITTNVVDLPADSMVEVRSDGAATNSVRADIYLVLDTVP